MDRVKPWRSVTHGTCALNGKHADPRLRAECPALRQKRASAPRRRAKASRTRTPGDDGDLLRRIPVPGGAGRRARGRRRGPAMRALAGGIPRAFRWHRTPEGAAYGRYARAKLARLGSLSADAAPWLREAGLLTLDLGRLHEEGEAVRQALTSGAGRRARDRARVQMRQLERRAARLRGQLADAEARLEALAGERKPTPDEQLDRVHEAMAAARREAGDE